MRRNYKQYDVLKSQRINYSELSNDIKTEVAILGGLDIFTDAHVRGVTDITTKICEELNMNYNRLKEIVLGAYLHDVGKIMIPSEVLQKKGRLTDEEYSIMKTHTTHGYDICMKYKELRKYAPVARWHHESFDGSGYPDKLVGNQIPFEASLVKVADVYDALTRKRQYKEGFKRSDAFDIMLGDCKKNRMSSKILVHLVKHVINDIYKEINVSANNLNEYKDNINILHDIEKIYKQIYDRGYTYRLERKLKKYELAPGYDMSTNANLLTFKQKAYEKEYERYIFLQDELKKIQGQYNELCSLAKKEKWYPDEEYYV